MQRNDYLIKRKFNSYLVPSVLMIMAMQLGNIVDSILVASLIDIDGMTAISLSLPAIYFVQIIGFDIGIGGAVLMSVQLGKREIKKASGVFSACLISVVGLSLIFSVTAPFVTSPLSALLASTPKLQSLLEPYMFYYILFSPVLNLCILLSNVMTIDNCPKLGASAFVVSNIVNLALDFVFLKYTDMGMAGAALSTIIGYGCGNLFVIPYLLSKKRILKINLKEGLHCLKMMWQVMKAGASQASFLLMVILQYFILNTFIQNTLGSDNMAIYAVCVNSVEIVKLFEEGVVGVIQTIAGVLYGEKDYYGIRRLVKRTVIIVSVIVAFLMAVFLIFPDLILKLFSFDKPELYDTAILCVRMFSLSFAFFAANRITQIYYQTILKTSLSAINTILQGLVYLVPLSILFISLTGIIGVSISIILTEALAFFTVFFYRVIQQKRGKLPQKGFLMIPDKDSDVLCDITIKGEEQEAVAVAHQIVKCCKDNGIVSQKANAVGVAAEEMTVNISRYGRKKTKPNYIDINLSKVDNKLILRIRDDGVAFNPIEYKIDESDEFLLSGIKLVKKLTSNLSYTRVLNMNNTVIEVDC